MKRLLFLFVVFAVVAFMASGALAEEVDCCDPCPDCNDTARLQVDVTVRGVSCIWINESNIPYVETVIPCDPGICWGDPDCFNWKVWATGDYNRKILGWLLNPYTSVWGHHYKVNFGTPYGVGWVELPEAEGAIVATGIHNICDQDWRTVKVMIGADESAGSICNATGYLLFRIVDNFCENGDVATAYVF